MKLNTSKPDSEMHQIRCDRCGKEAERGALGFLRNLKVVGSLKVDPTLRVFGRTAKMASQAQCRVRRHTAALQNDIIDLAGRHMQRNRQRVGAQFERLQVIFPKNFTCVNRPHTVFQHKSLFEVCNTQSDAGQNTSVWCRLKEIFEHFQTTGEVRYFAEHGHKMGFGLWCLPKLDDIH